jgi:cytochrome c-type biogenesis protein
MSRPVKIIVVLVLAALVAWVVVLKQRERARERAAAGAGEGSAPTDATLPLLLEVGGKSCPPCKAMEPVLASLRAKYAGQLRVEVVDYGEDETVAERYRVMQIPSQLFFDAAGRELWRNEGPISEEAVVAKWRELGVALAATDAAGGSETSGTPFLARLFESARRFLSGAPAVALAAAFVWGILSMLLSPCHLASIPLIVGFIDSQGRTTARRAFVTASLFSLGILITFAVVGGVTAAAGRVLGSVDTRVNYLVAAMFFLVALVLLDVVPFAWSGPGQVGMKRRGLVAAFLLGLIFGVAIGPCTFIYLAPLLGVAFRVGETALAFGILLLVVYGVGHCAIIVAAGTSTGLVQRWLDWHGRSRGAVWLKRACGALVAAGGLYLIYTVR